MILVAGLVAGRFALTSASSSANDPSASGSLGVSRPEVTPARGQHSRPASTAPATATRPRPASSGPATHAAPAAPGTSAARATTGTGATPSAVAITLPPLNATADYQLGGAYTPAAGVRIVTRDRTDAPMPGSYNICYVNAFQTQSDELSFWTGSHADLLLMSGGAPVVDPDWSEDLLDISTPQKRERLAAIVGGWLRGCHQSGFQAVELDNLDSWTRSDGLLTADEAVAYLRLLAARAHVLGLAVAQKNAAELSTRRAETGADFAVAEECVEYGECGAYASAYHNHVIVIEYDRGDFTAGCQQWPGLSVVLRDRDLVPRGASGYVYATC